MLLVGSGIYDEGCGTAWTIYPPLSLSASHGGLSVESFIIALHAVGLSSLSGAINVLTTVCYARRGNTTLNASSLYT
jgi:cytochrome c oxidase subunit 1